MNEKKGVKRPFIYRYNAFCRFISGDYKSQGVVDRLGYWAVLTLLKISTGFIMVMIVLAGVRSISDFCDVSINLVSFLTIEVYALLFVLRGEAFNAIVSKLASLWLEAIQNVRTLREQSRVEKCVWSIRIIVPLLNSGAFAIFIGYATAPIVLFFTSTSKNRRMGLPFKMAKFLEHTDYSTVICIYVIAVACLSYSCFIIINLNALYLSMLCTLDAGLHLTSLFMCRAYENRWVYANRKTADKYTVTMTDFQLGLDLKRSFVRHQQWLRAAMELKHVMNERFLVLHMGTITVTTLASFLTANDPAHHYYQIAMAFIPLGIYFLFFFKATSISATAGQFTADRLYFCHMRMPALMKIDSKTFLFIMRRLQRPVFFEIGKIWHLSLMRFVSILQHIFSVIMLLRSINNRTMSPSVNGEIEVT
nr:PREDICTED: uncharacterized protein LOC109031597 [Bemisia tabaci]